MQPEFVFAKIRQGDTLAFKSIFDLYYQPLCTYLRTFTHDFALAEDVVQATFVNFWNKREQIEIKTSIKSYLYTMAYNELMQSYRKSKKRKDLLQSLIYDALSEKFIADEDFMDKKIERLKACIEALPLGARKILKLKQEGMKNKDIAEHLNLSIKTVEAQIRITFKKIRQDFKEHHLFFMLVSTLKPLVRRIQT